MNPASGVIHFNCQSCGTLLTVPAEMAGVTGPCPHCRATITSPRPAPAPAPQQANPFAPIHQAGFPSAPPVQQPAPMPMPAPAVQYQPITSPVQTPSSLPSPLGMPTAPMAQPAAQHPHHGGWHQPQPQQQMPAPAPMPQVSPLQTGMTGASWPPAPTATSTQEGMNTGAHPVMDRLLRSPSPLPSPATVPPYQDRGVHSSRKRMSSSRDHSRRGAMWVAFFMAVLALAGTSWFFRDQLRAAWLTYKMKGDESENTTLGNTPENPQAPSVPDPASGPTSVPSQFDPTAPTPVKAPPQQPPVAPQRPPTAASSSTPEPTVLPALPAATTPTMAMMPDATTSPGSLVEVPSATPSPGPPVNVSPSAPSAPAVIVGVKPETQPALETLLRFFDAKTWRERLPYVQAPDSMQPIMEKYYATNSDGPLYPSNIQMIRYDQAPETGPPHCVFQVAGGGLKQPLPIMVEISDKGWKVDWLTFTEFKDDLLFKFFASPQPEPARFHVLMRRAHYFDDDVPGLDKKTCFQVMPPMPGFSGDTFAVKGSDLAKELDKHLGWDVRQAAAVVELQWRKESNYQWVELTNLIQLNWRNVEPSAPKAVPVEEDPPKAAPSPKK